MKKYFQQLKHSDKTGLKLSLIYGLNRLIRFLLRGQCLLISALFSGLVMDYVPEESQIVVVTFYQLAVLGICLVEFCHIMLSGQLKRGYKLLKVVIFYLFFYGGYVYISQHSLSQSLVNLLFYTILISVFMATLATYLQPKLFEYYLIKKVINREYLGIRKWTAPLPPAENLYVDAKEEHVDKRMRLINQRAIRPAYQSFVELSFLDRKVITGIGYEAVTFGEEPKRSFIEDDTIYYPVFRVYPFGKRQGISHQLVQFKLSKKEAFMKQGSFQLEAKKK